MSGQAGEAIIAADGSEVVELPAHGDAAFGALMDALAPEPEGGTDQARDPATGQFVADGGAAAGAAPASGGGDTAPAAGTDGTGTGAPAGTGEPAATGADSGAAADATGGAGDRPASWTAEAVAVQAEVSQYATAIEDRMTEAYQTEALAAVREEHKPYFEAIETHPRLLVGKEVPRVDGKEGFETLRDEADAQSWQEAVKHQLVAEIRSRTEKQMEENSGFFNTVHSSIDLFKNNADLVPNTKDFDVELANRFVTLAAPYELRVDGKLQGYSIPVQPIIDQLRSQIVAERAKVATPPAASAGAGGPAAGAPASTPGTPAAPAQGAQEQPQAGISSKAGSGAAGAEDFSALFGTLGLPNLRI